MRFEAGFCLPSIIFFLFTSLRALSLSLPLAFSPGSKESATGNWRETRSSPVASHPEPLLGKAIAVTKFSFEANLGLSVFAFGGFRPVWQPLPFFIRV